MTILSRLLLAVMLLTVLLGCKTKTDRYSGTWMTGPVPYKEDLTIPAEERAILKHAAERGFELSFGQNDEFQMRFGPAFAHGKVVWDGDVMRLEPGEGSTIPEMRFKRDGEQLVSHPQVPGEPGLRLVKVR